MAENDKPVTQKELDFLNIGSNASRSDSVTNPQTQNTVEAQETTNKFSRENLSKLFNTPQESAPSADEPNRLSRQNLNTLFGVSEEGAQSQQNPLSRENLQKTLGLPAENRPVAKSEAPSPTTDPNRHTRALLGDTTTDLLGSLAGGAAQAVGGTLKGLSRFGEIAGDGKDVDENIVFSAGQAIEDFSKTHFPVSQEAQQNLSNQIATGIGQGVATIGAGAAAAVVGPVTGLVSMALMGAAQTGNQQAEDYLQTLGSAATEEETESAFIAGAPLGLIEAIPGFVALARLDKATAGLATKIFGKKIASFASGHASTKVGQFATLPLLGAVSEGLTEATQELAANLIASDVLEYDTERQAFSGVAEAGEVGAGTGLALNALISALPGRSKKSVPTGKFEEIDTPAIADGLGDTPQKSTLKSIKNSKEVVTPETGRAFVSKEVETEYKQASEQAETFLTQVENGESSDQTGEAIKARIDTLNTIAEESQDPAVKQEVQESISLLETVLAEDTVVGEAGDTQVASGDAGKQEQIQAVSDLLFPEGKAEDIAPVDTPQDPVATPIAVPEAEVATQEFLDKAAEDTPVTEEKRSQPALREEINNLPKDQKDLVIDQLRNENQELTRRLLTSEVAGIPNKVAFNDAPKKEFIASLDIDSLKFLNDNLGHKGGDDLIAKVAQAVNAQLPGDSFHVSGDEIVAQGDNQVELEAALTRAQEALASDFIEGTDVATGTPAIQEGLSFTFGVDTDLEAADAAMLRSKEEKTRQGLRAARGEAPKGFKTFPTRDTPSPEVMEETLEGGSIDLDTVETELANLDAEIVAARQDPLFDPDELADMRETAGDLRKVVKAEKAANPNKDPDIEDALPPNQTVGDFLEESILSENGVEVEALSSDILLDTGPDAQPDAPDLSPNRAAVDFFRNTLNKEALDGLDIFSVDTWKDLPKDIRKTVKDAPGIKAIYQKAKGTSKPVVYFVNNRFNTPQEVIQTALHEIVGHHGVRNIMKDGDYDKILQRTLNLTPAIRQDILSKVVRWQEYLTRWENAGNSAANLNPSNSADFKTPLGRTIRIPNEVALQLADEYIADLAKQRLLDKEFVDSRLGILPTGSRNRQAIDKAFTRVLTAIKHSLRKVFGNFSDQFTVDHLNAAIAKSADSLFKQQSLVFDRFSNGQQKASSDLTESLSFATPEIRAEAESIARRQGVDDVDILATVAMANQNKAQVRTSMFTSGDAIYNKIANKFRTTKGFKWLTSRGSLRGAEALGQIKRLTFAKHAEVDTFLRKGRKAFNTLQPAQKRLALKFMTTPGADISTVPVPTDTKDYLVEAKLRIEELGQRLVDGGHLSNESFQENKGGYLTTVYAKYMKETGATGMKTSFLNWAKKKKDIPKEMRDELGEILDPEILVGETISTMAHDAAILDMFKSYNEFSNAQGMLWVLDNNAPVTWQRQTAAGFKKVTKPLSELTQDLTRLRFRLNEEIAVLEDGGTSPELRILEANIAALDRAVQQGQEQMAADMREQVLKSAEVSGEISAEDFDSSTYIEDNYKRVPNERRYGALAGKYLRKEIYKDMVNPLQNPIPGVEVLQKANDFWKFSKAVASPAQLVHNMMGNLGLADAASSRNSLSVTKWMMEGIAGRFTGNVSEWSAIHDRVAGDSATFASDELRIPKKDALRLAKEQQRISQVSGPMRTLEMSKWMMDLANTAAGKTRDLRSGVGEIMQLMERGSKDMMIRDFMTRWNEQNNADYKELPAVERDALFVQAVEYANKNLFDYSDVPEFVNFLRRNPLGSPFLTFTYKAIPAVMRGYSNNPHKLAQHLAIPSLVSGMAMAAFGEFNEEDQEELVRLLPDWMKETGSLMFIPIKDENGNPSFLDTSYLLPGATAYRIFHQMATDFDEAGDVPLGSVQALSGLALDSLGLLGGFVPGSIVAVATNKDGLGREIVNKQGTPTEQMSSIIGHIYNTIAPTAMATNGPLRKMYQASQDEIPVNATGNPKFTGTQAALSFAGISVRTADKPNLLRQANAGFSAAVRDIKREKAKVLRDRNIDSAEKASKLKFLNQRQVHERQELNRKLGINPKGDI